MPARKQSSGTVPPGPEHTRTGLSAETLRQAFLDNLFYIQGRFPEIATDDDRYQALSYTVRDRLLHRWVRTIQAYKERDPRTVCYLSAEYLPGPHLANNLLSLGIVDATREALRGLGLDLDAILDHEEEPGLGNGGLGRLAACFMDSLATLEIPAIGYGIRYEYGIFDQKIQDGWQVETSDTWLHYGNPWEVRRPGICYDVRIGGRTEHVTDEHGRLRVHWRHADLFRGVAYDTPVAGYGVETVNLLRLWRAEAAEDFDFTVFNQGDYVGAVMRKVRSETISKVLYPNDEADSGKRLRLLQQYFFVSCSLQDMLRIFATTGRPLAEFHAKFAAQLNDTHPTIAVAELMRLLVDEHGLDWDEAWQATRHTFAYTNHTLLPEALEKWPLPLFADVLPRHLEIVYEINRRFLDDMRLRYPDDPARIARLSIIDETPPKYVRMAHLASVGGHAINGVAALHTRLLGTTVLKDFHDIWPDKFQNKTNGVTPRRFLMLANPGLADLLTEALGDGWTRDLERLRGLEGLADDPAFQDRWRQAKLIRKAALAERLRAGQGNAIDPASLFDIQAKRIHEYKRQHLNLLHVVTLYNRLKHAPDADVPARTVLFGGKAAPGYAMAKLIIKLINAVAEVVNRDPDMRDRLKVVFVPDYNVKVAQSVYPAADLSEQISTAGMEASGTGNMKFSLNGALTIGTLDGANVEIREAVGPDNFFLFGLDADEAVRTRAAGYRPYALYERDPELRAAVDLIAGGHFAHGDAGLFRPLVDHLLGRDDYLLLADYRAYVDCQDRVADAWRDPARWTRMAILNVARMGRFSSDRAIAEYCRDIWNVAPARVDG
ncbi:glycogen/starch/alpha-glucan phosphorylase [Parasulfuritortus cantonensis]|uniref:Alpha-1,4 glucan phosphorylase n=1 Tax=Parasulfuritortus cantonensis TaxID=2528202 RepID=A0A4V2NV28_9PROT|nr:glycogen/starch/alpha-glucan phosphorylase [Parasulfuritortus cantonensis]TCJ11836.1 glycogen/starch/alpha-glucan phosphorylase [Parasulfuritortus cantonensis]